MDNGFDIVKDTTPYIAITTGGGAAVLTPSLIISAVGAFVGLLGLVMAFYRYRESKRANDIAESRLNWEKEKHAKDSNPPKDFAVRDENES